MGAHLSPTFRISLGLSGLIISLCLGVFAVGLVPSAWQSERFAGVTAAAEIASQIGTDIGNLDQPALERAMRDLQTSHPELKSIGVRGPDGALIASSSEHVRLWRGVDAGAIQSSQFIFDLFEGGARHGQVEIKLDPDKLSSTIAGFPEDYVRFSAVMWFGSFIAAYAFLKRIFRELDPKHIVPERVQSAFDTMAEGVLILDMEGQVLLINRSMCQKLGQERSRVVGRDMASFCWIDEEGADCPMPWRDALEGKQQIAGQRLSLRGSDGELLRFVVNVAPILDQRDAMRGVIVTFDDITTLHAMNEELRSANKTLELQQEEITWKNTELAFLASRDPLTGCLNRRAFFEEAERAIDFAHAQEQPVSCLMVDIDHFKSINDTFGHDVGDRVIAEVGRTLEALSRGTGHLVGRYGGEEFCVLLQASDEAEAIAFADAVRQEIEQRSHAWISGRRTITVSIGQATHVSHQPLVDLVKSADQALYVAKRSGRNRVVAVSSCAERAVMEGA